MARVLLINPSMDMAAGFGDYKALSEAMPPTGLAYVAGAARRHGHDVRMIDDFVENRGDEGLLQFIGAYEPDVIGIPVLTPVAQGIEQFCSRLRRERPGAKIVFGNLHASVFAEEMVERGICDVVVHGEGEERFPSVVDGLTSESDFSSLPGITWKPNGAAKTTGPAPQIRELDTLARPAWDLLPWSHYTFLPFVTVARPCLAVLGSRGCPYRCTYCVEGDADNRLRVRKPGRSPTRSSGLSAITARGTSASSIRFFRSIRSTGWRCARPFASAGFPATGGGPLKHVSTSSTRKSAAP
ncbi:MAG: cobalamin-dependent protein [Deltaproteobacteria bacterium]|nr:cobalamin-dependent protein [Deltaproteobacteria bacterium]